MNITKEQTGEQTATICISLQQSDIENEVNKALKDYQRKASIPGFRPGKVPFGMVKKMYGNAIMADQVNKTISDSLNNYLSEEKIAILGHPVANIEKTGTVDFDHQTEYNFYFDIGIAPHFDLLMDKLALDFVKITAGEKQLEETIQNLLEKNPSHSHPEETGANDTIDVSLTETDENGSEKAEGYRAEISFNLNAITNEETKKQLIGKNDGAEFAITLADAFASADEFRKTIQWPENDTNEPPHQFNLVVKEIHREEKAELNEEFFDRIFPGQEVNSLELFKVKLTDDINRQLEGESERYFAGKAIEALIDQTSIQLPEEFMKTWMMQNAEGKLTREQLDQDYVHYDRTFRWQLIESKLIENEPSLYVTQNEVREHVKKQFFGQFMETHEADEEMNKRMEPIVDMILKNQDEARKITDQIAERKIATYLRENAKVTVKEMPYDEFIESIKPKE